MKKLYLILIATTLIISCENNKKTETVTVKHESSIINPEVSFGVRGNCGMCKTTIEKAALSVDGVEEASWSTATKILDIKTKTSLDSTPKLFSVSDNCFRCTKNVLEPPINNLKFFPS